jgi:hypothetical protein
VCLACGRSWDPSLAPNNCKTHFYSQRKISKVKLSSETQEGILPLHKEGWYSLKTLYIEDSLMFLFFKLSVFTVCRRKTIKPCFSHRVDV